MREMIYIKYREVFCRISECMKTTVVLINSQLISNYLLIDCSISFSLSIIFIIILQYIQRLMFLSRRVIIFHRKLLMRLLVNIFKIIVN